MTQPGSRRRWTGLCTVAAFLLASTPAAWAEDFSLTGKPDAEPSNKPSGVKISPDAFKQLNPEQQQLVQQRLNGGKGTPSSETKPTSPSAPTSDESSAKPDAASAEETSEFERALAERPPETISTRIKQFGYDLFAGGPSTFAPVVDLPVPADYAIGPGDEIIVSALSPGRSNEFSLTVNRDGTVYYPNIGVISVAGMPYSRMVDLLTQKIKGHASEMRLAIRMGKLRTIKVFVIGKVKRPGAYTISALSNLSNALIACGGPTKAGSLRDIQLKRFGRTLAHFDYYDLLMRGDSSQDLRMQSGDVIFIPEAGPLVAVAGNVRSPAIYELKGKTSLLDALKLAGNITPMGFTQQVQVERYYENRVKKILDVNLNGQGDAGKVTLQDGDLVKVFPTSQKLVNGVMLEGNVERPGKYEYRPNLRLHDLIHGEVDLKPESYMDFGLIEREMAPDDHVELFPFNLGKMLAGDPQENKLLKPRDTVRIYYRWAIQEQPKVRIAGAVHHGGEFQLHPNMTLDELIQLAGGVQEQADLSQAELTRVQIIDNRMNTTRLSVDLQKVLQKDPGANLTLQKDDYLLIKPVPEYKLYRTITLQGEISQPGTYTFKSGETLSDVIRRAGGFTSHAYTQGAIFTRVSLKELQEQRLKEAAQKLQSDIVSATSAKVGSALSADAVQANTEELALKKSLLASLDETHASGRMIVRLDEVTAPHHRPDQDVQLEDGDNLLVPPLVNSISVLGQVYNPTGITYTKGMRASDYISQAGGPTERADVGGIYIIKANGSVLTNQNYHGGWLWTRGVKSAVLEPGDTVLVPENLKVDTSIRDIRDITQVLFQIATTAAITWGIVKK